MKEGRVLKIKQGRIKQEMLEPFPVEITSLI